MARYKSEVEILINGRAETAAAVRQAESDFRRLQALTKDSTFAGERGMSQRGASLQEDMERRMAANTGTARLEIAEMEIRLLERQADLGNDEARRTLQRLRLEAQHARERERLVAITKTSLITDEARAAAQRQLIALDRLHTQELLQQDKLTRGRVAQEELVIQARRQQAAEARGTGSGMNIGAMSRLLLTGGAAGFVGSRIGHGMQSMSRSFQDVAMGAKSARDFVDELYNGIPVVGPLANGLQRVKELMDGSAIAAAKQAEAFERSVVAGRRMAEQRQMSKDIAGRVGEMEARGRFEMSMLGTDDEFERREIAERERFRQENDELWKLYTEQSKANRPEESFATSERMVNAEREHEARLRKIEDDRAAAEAKQHKERFDEEVAAEERRADDISRIRSDLRVKELELEGRSIDARIERAREGYRREIEAARAAGDEEKAALLEKNQALDEQLARRGESDSTRTTAASASPFSVGPGMSRFLTGVQDQAAQNSPIERQTAEIKRGNDIQARVLAAIEQLSRKDAVQFVALNLGG